MSLLEVRNLRVRFEGGRGPVQAVESISFDLDAGETLALVGESGSGKTATALALLSLLPRGSAVVETGEAWFDGRNLLALGQRELRAIRGREIGFVFQDATSALHPLIPVGTQLAEVLQVHERLPRRAALARAAEALAEVGIPDATARLAACPHELSGGMRQRAMIAMALLCRPRLLIADEPTTALDVTVQAQVMELLDDLRRRHGTAILLITHDLALVAGFAERVLVMYAGAVAESAPTRELFARPAHPYTRALLRSAPSLVAPIDEPLPSIPGSPPDRSRPAPGCAFQPRCAYARPRCASEVPPLLARPIAPDAPAGAWSSGRGPRVACFESARVLAESAQPASERSGT